MTAEQVLEREKYLRTHKKKIKKCERSDDGHTESSMLKIEECHSPISVAHEKSSSVSSQLARGSSSWASNPAENITKFGLKMTISSTTWTLCDIE
jgi:hypothetical protein